MALTDRQRALLEQWLPGAAMLHDHSWGDVGTMVLELGHDGARYVAKAGGEADHHLAREARAHQQWLRPWTSIGRAPRLVHADDEAKLLLTEYLPGSLVQGDEAEWQAGTYRQAGELLARLHAQPGIEDVEFEARANAKSLAWLARPHRIGPRRAARLRELIESWPTPPSLLVPTHGDWQPRNWLIHDGVVSVIDFGRTELRPAMTDFGRLAVQQFRTDPALEPAFLAGYGADPREPAAWQRIQLREAIGTAAWAYQVGDERFEAQGHRMLDEALTRW
jgi:hypothetical protein